MLCDLHCGRMIRIFWPENSLAPVINAVLALYIITAALQLVRGADWQSLAAELYALTAAETEMSDSYEEYGEQLGQEASAQAIRTVLGQRAWMLRSRSGEIPARSHCFTQKTGKEQKLCCNPAAELFPIPSRREVMRRENGDGVAGAVERANQSTGK